MNPFTSASYRSGQSTHWMVPLVVLAMAASLLWPASRPAEAASQRDTGRRNSPEAVAGGQNAPEGQQQDLTAPSQADFQIQRTLSNFRAQTRREATLYQIIQQLQREVVQLRMELKKTKQAGLGPAAGGEATGKPAQPEGAAKPGQQEGGAAASGRSDAKTTHRKPG